MKWSELYPKENPPVLSDVTAWVDSPLWEEFLAWMSGRGMMTALEYSRCGMDPGWNVKGKKKSKAICALYPRQGFFTYLVVLGPRLVPLAEGLMEDCTPETRQRFSEASPMGGSRWVVLDVTGPELLEDAKRLSALKIDF